MKKIKYWIIALTVAAAVSSGGCTPDNRSFWSGASIRISKSSLRIVDIAKIQVSVTGEGIEEVVRQNLTKTNGQWRGVIKQIPAGSKRRFLAVAYDSTGKALFEGSATNVELLPQKTAGIMITLQQKTPNDPFRNTVPVITSLITTSLQVAPQKSIDLQVNANDNDSDDSISYTWTAQSGSFDKTTTASTTWTAPQTTGSYRLTITVSDNHGAIVVVSLDIRVASQELASADVQASFNTWPRVLSMFAEPGRVNRGESISLSVDATDLDGDSLQYEWKAEGQGCSGRFHNAKSAYPTWASPANLPKDTQCFLKVAVQDGKGGKSYGTLIVQLGDPIKVQVVPARSIDNTPPTSTIDPPGGTLVPFLLNVTIFCKDTGSGCRRIVYTMDGTKPSFSPRNGTIVNGDKASIELFSIDPLTIFDLRFASEDKAGNREAPQSALYRFP